MGYICGIDCLAQKRYAFLRQLDFACGFLVAALRNPQNFVLVLIAHAEQGWLRPLPCRLRGGSAYALAPGRACQTLQVWLVQQKRIVLRSRRSPFGLGESEQGEPRSAPA